MNPLDAGLLSRGMAERGFLFSAKSPWNRSKDRRAFTLSLLGPGDIIFINDPACPGINLYFPETGEEISF